LPGVGSINGSLVDAGCELLLQLNFIGRDEKEDYAAGAIARNCLLRDQGAAVATAVCAKLKAAVGAFKTHASYREDLLNSLFSVQPFAALDGLCGGDAEELDTGISVLRNVGMRTHPLTFAAEAELCRWCDEEPSTRYPALACVVPVVNVVNQVNDNAPQWTSVALRFLERAPDPEAVLTQFVRQFKPSGAWSGSLAAILQSNAGLLDQLDAYPTLIDAVAREKERLKQWIQEERDREAVRDQFRAERFE